MTKSLSRVVGEGTVWASGSTLLLKVVGLGYAVIVLSNLSVYEYGVTELVLSIPPLLSILSLPGLESVLMADMGVEKGKGNVSKMRYLLESYMSMRIVTGILAWALLFFSAPLIQEYYNENIATLVRIVSFSFLFGPFRTLAQTLFRVSLQFREMALYAAAEEIGKFIIVAICLLWLDMSILAVGLAYVGADVVALLLFGFPMYKIYQRLFSGTKFTDGFKSPLYLWYEHGKWSVFGSYLGNFGQNIRLWFIKVFVSTEAVAIFSVAVGLFQHTAALLPLHKILAPMIPQYVDEKKRFYKLIDKGIKYQVLGYAIIGLGGAICFPILFLFVFPEYMDSYFLYLVLLLALIPAGMSSIFSSVFFAFKAQRDLFFAIVLRTVMIIILLPILLPMFGLFGAAFEFVATRTIFTWERYRKLCKIAPDFRVNVRDFTRFDSVDRELLRAARAKVSGSIGFLTRR